jgi:hypothetical protein
MRSKTGLESLDCAWGGAIAGVGVIFVGVAVVVLIVEAAEDDEGTLAAGATLTLAVGSVPSLRPIKLTLSSCTTKTAVQNYGAHFKC